MIAAKGLTKRYAQGQAPALTVLDGVDFTVEAGDFVAITGRSGSGKSTLLHVLGGLDSDFTGEVTVAGQALNGLDDKALARFRQTQVAFVFQSFHLVAGLTALENVALPALFGPRGEGDQGHALEMLARVGLAHKAQSRPEQLSGGERQRVAIARALFVRPQVLLCDEPTGNLDSATGDEVIALFKALNAQGLTVVAVTHEERLAQVATRLLQLEAGKLS